MHQPVPHPDPNPLDCNGHGSHVAGTAAGTGVLANGATYTGTYDATTVSSNSWTVGPGVAPKADIYSIRVFGCNGSTDVTATFGGVTGTAQFNVGPEPPSPIVRASRSRV